MKRAVKEYKLIITPTNKTIIIDKETGKKGMARLHPDDSYNFLEGVKVAMDKLNGVEPKKIRTIGELPVGTKIKILNETQGWGHVKEGAIGTLINTNTATWNGEKAVAIEFNENKNWKLKSDVKEGEYFEVIEEDKKSILSEPEFKKGIVNQPSYRLWNNPLCIDEINKTYEANVVLVRDDMEDSMLVNVIGKAKSSYGDVYIIEYKNKRYVAYCNDVEKYEPKLYDSNGVELFDGDKVISVSSINSIYHNIIEKYETGIRNDGLDHSHNSKRNNGHPADDWKVYKNDFKLYTTDGVELKNGDKVLVIDSKGINKGKKEVILEYLVSRNCVKLYVYGIEFCCDNKTGKIMDGYKVYKI